MTSVPGTRRTFERLRPRVGFKFCRDCGAEKPLTDFYNATGNKDGKQTSCRECQDVTNYQARGASGSSQLPPQARDRLLSRCSRHGDCLLWTGPVSVRGHGKLEILGAAWMVHRMAYALEVGSIPPRMIVYQVCGNKLCVEPSHLKAKRSRSLVGDGTKFCSRCGEVLPLSEFYGQRGANGRLQAYCKDCHRFDAYGITQREYDDLLKIQAGLCAICDMPSNGRSLSIDHCHSSGAVRRLLCSSCNVALGMLRDDIRLFHRAIEYLSKASV